MAEPGAADPVAPEAVLAGEPLDLAAVLEAVDRFHPIWLAVAVDRERAEGELIEARGGFDTRLTAAGEAVPKGYYDRYTGEFGIDQPTTFLGSRLFGGYKIGRGDFPSYLGASKTNKAGRVLAGLEVPLLRDRAIDDGRAELRSGEIGRDVVEPQIELTRVALVREASESFWTWVATGLNVGVERRLLETARERQEQLRGRADRGAIPPIQLVDNERLIVDRKIRLRGAERDVAAAAIALSLFYRDADGNASRPSARRLPRDFPDERMWDEQQLVDDIERAQAQHPQLREFRLKRDELENRYELARNRLLPDLRLRLAGSQDFGSSSGSIDTDGDFEDDAKDEFELKASLRFEVPVRQREARGRALALRSELRRLDLETRLARDQIEAEIRAAMVSLRAAFDQTLLARENLDLAMRMEQAEVRKLRLGSSDLINVNIREVQAADAARALIFAQAAYFRSLARYRAAMAVVGESHPSGMAPEVRSEPDLHDPDAPA